MNDAAESPENQLQAMLRALWRNNRATIDERMQRLRETPSQITANQMDDTARKEAESAAHKLAGVLGTFGLPEGSRLASNIEALFAGDTTLDETTQHQLAQWLDELEKVLASKSS